MTVRVINEMEVLYVMWKFLIYSFFSCLIRLLSVPEKLTQLVSIWDASQRLCAGGSIVEGPPCSLNSVICNVSVPIPKEISQVLIRLTAPKFA